jgi:hypothetical protein
MAVLGFRKVTDGRLLLRPSGNLLLRVRMWESTRCDSCACRWGDRQRSHGLKGTERLSRSSTRLLRTLSRDARTRTRKNTPAGSSSAHLSPNRTNERPSTCKELPRPPQDKIIALSTTHTHTSTNNILYTTSLTRLFRYWQTITQ